MGDEVDRHHDGKQYQPAQKLQENAQTRSAYERTVESFGLVYLPRFYQVVTESGIGYLPGKIALLANAIFRE